MNDRIKQIAIQAGLKLKEQPLHYTNTSNPIDFPVSANRDIENFASLIVQECAALLVKEATENCDVDTETYYALMREAKWMKRYFGVEE